MKRIALKILLIGVFSLSFSNFLSAQSQFKGHQGGGINFVIGADQDYTNYGIGFKYQWNFIQHMRLEPSITFFFKKDNISSWDLTMNYHYLFNMGNSGFTLYPIAGIGMTHLNVDNGGLYEDLLGKDASNSVNNYFAFNFGGGAEYAITQDLSACFEYKYRLVNNWNRSHFTFGIAYKF